MLEERATEAFKKYEQELKRRAKSYCYREQIAGLNWQDYYSEFLITFVKLTQEFEADGPEFERGLWHRVRYCEINFSRKQRRRMHLTETGEIMTIRSEADVMTQVMHRDTLRKVYDFRVGHMVDGRLIMLLMACKPGDVGQLTLGSESAVANRKRIQRAREKFKAFCE